MAAAAPRRITPQVLPPSAEGRRPPAPAVQTAVGGSVQTAGDQPAVIDCAVTRPCAGLPACGGGVAGTRNGAAAPVVASKVLGGEASSSCRRLYVDLTASNEVNYRKLCKQWKKEHGPGVSAHPGLEARLTGPPVGTSGSPGGPDSLLRKFDGKKDGNKPNDTVLAGVIKRLEMMHSAKEDDDSDVEYEAGSEGGTGDRSQAPTPSQSAAPKKLGKRNLQKGDVQGDDVGGPDDNYDHDDPFIDDGEMIDLYEADLKRPKHGGFFINKGSIEKTEEAVNKQLSPFVGRPKRKKNKPTKVKPKTPSKGKNSAAQPKAPKAAMPVADKKPTKAAAVGGGTPVAKQAKAIKATTPAGKTLVDKPKPATSSAAAAAAEGGAKEGDAAPIPEKLKLPLDKFRQAADACALPEKESNSQQGNRTARLPTKLEKLLAELALVFFREAKREATKSAVLEVLGASVSKLGFEDPEGTMSKKLQHQYAVAKHRLKKATKEFQESVAAAAEEQKPKLCGTNPGAAHSTPGKDAAGQGGASAEEEEDDFQAPSKAAASSFKWGDDLDRLLMRVVELSSKIHGWPTAGTEAARKNIYLPMCKFWPDWLPMDVKTLQARYKKTRAKTHAAAAAGKTLKRPSEDPAAAATGSPAKVKKTAAMPDLVTSAAPGAVDAGSGDAAEGSPSNKAPKSAKLQQSKLSVAAMAAAAGTSAAADNTAKPSDVAAARKEPPKDKSAPKEKSKEKESAKPSTAPGLDAAPAEGQTRRMHFIRKGISAGGDEQLLREDVPEDIDEKRGEAIPAKSIIIMALCDAGSEGLSTKEMIDRVNTLGLANWEEKKKAYLSSGVMKDDRILKMEKRKYILRAFKDVTALKPAPGAALPTNAESNLDPAGEAGED